MAREADIDSQIIKLKKITAMTDVYLPNEETTFHVVKASG